jgi:hypothetical protein
VFWTEFWTHCSDSLALGQNIDAGVSHYVTTVLLYLPLSLQTLFVLFLRRFPFILLTICVGTDIKRSITQRKRHLTSTFLLKRDSFDFIKMYFIQHCFVFRPSDSTVSEDAGIEPRTVLTLTLAVRRSYFNVT